jgi:dihydrolipoamide dehydrogenase
MQTELLVVGGGPAGYTAAIRGAQRGLDVTLVEDGLVGGTCLNHGCIPSKALLSATGTVHEMETAEEMGIYVEPYVDVGEMVSWKDGIVDRLTNGVAGLCRQNGVELVDGFARFEDEHTVTVDGEEEISFENAILATGSRPVELPAFGYDADPIWDSRQALAADRAPPRLLVVGAGYIGMELSTIFSRLGSNVTVVEMLDEPLPQYDADLTDPVLERVSELGVTVNFGEAAAEWRRDGSDVVVTTETEVGETSTYSVDKALVAVGREPVTDGLNLHAASVETDDRGFVETDEYGRSKAEHVFAVGDVAGEPMLAHTGMHEGIVAVETIAGEEPPKARAVPAVVFTSPEIATVGLNPEEARAEGIDPVVGEFPFSASGRAMTTRETSGFVRLVAAADGRVVGGQVVGPEASELVAEIGLAVQTGATLEEVAETIHTHPTLSEATMEAAEHALGRAIHTTNR